MHPTKWLFLFGTLAAAAPAQDGQAPLSWLTRLQSGNGFRIVVPHDGHDIEVLLRDGKLVSATCKDQPVVIKETKTGGSRITMGGAEVLVVEPANEAPALTLQPRRAHLGVTMGRIDEALAAHLEVEPDQVAMVLEAPEGQPAHQAGIRKFDVLVEVEGQSPATEDKVREVLRGKKPGDRLQLKVQRRGGEKLITVTLGETTSFEGLLGGGLKGWEGQANRYRTLSGLTLPNMLDASRRYSDAVRLFGQGASGKDLLTLKDLFNPHLTSGKAEGDQVQADLLSIKQQLDRLDELLKRFGERTK